MKKNSFFACAIAMVVCSAPAFGKNIRSSFDSLSDTFRGAVEEYGEDFESIQKSLDKYQWKGLVSEKATLGAVTLKDMKLNGHRRFAAVKPGDTVEGEVKWSLDRSKRSPFGKECVVIGLQNVGGQACLNLSETKDKGHERFELAAPMEPGVYQVLFHLADGSLTTSPANLWKGSDESAAIGVIIVK